MHSLQQEAGDYSCITTDHKERKKKMLDCENKKDVDKKESVFDLVEVYKERVIPKVEELVEICEEIGLPHLFSFVIQSNEKGYANGVVCSSQNKQGLAVSKMMAVGHMINDSSSEIIPVKLDVNDPKSLLAALALTAMSK